MIKKFLYEKYGEFVTDKLLTGSNEVIWENYNENGNIEQDEVKKHLKSLNDIDGKPLLPETFWRKDVEWGVDFSGWIGEVSNKDFFIIGAEPHIWKNYQLVYDFGNLKDKSVEESAMEHYNRKDDIWCYLTNTFIDSKSPKDITNFLKKCYITDLCHIVPKKCGQISAICEHLEISATEWQSFRKSVAERFLKEEIRTVNPKVVILHGNPSRYFFRDEFNITDYHIYKIEDSKYTIQTWSFDQRTVISIPHLKGSMKNMLWKCKKFPNRQESAKKIINKIVSSLPSPSSPLSISAQSLSSSSNPT